MANIPVGVRLFISKGLAVALLLVLCLIPLYLLAAISARATLYSLPSLIASTVIFLCGLWTILCNPGAPKHRLFALVCACLSLVGGGLFLSSSSSNANDALLWHAFGYAGLIYLPAVAYHLSRAALAVPAGTLVWVSYTVSTAWLGLLATASVLNGSHDFFWGPYPRAGFLHPLFILYFVSMNVMMLTCLSSAMRAAAGPERQRRSYLFYGCLFASAMSLDFLPCYGFEFYPVGYLVSTTSVLIAAYGIAKDQFPTLSPSLAKPSVLAYLEAFSLLLLFYLVILFAVQYFTGVLSYELTGFLLATSTLFAGLLASIQKHMETMVGKALFKERHEAYETLTEFSQAMVSILDLPTLTQTILTTLQRVLHIRALSIFLLDGEKDVYVLAASSGPGLHELKGLRFSAAEELPHHLRCAQSLVVGKDGARLARERAPESILRVLGALSAEVCLPLINKDRLIGFINLGPRNNHQRYSDSELHLLTTLAQNAAVAADNAMLYTDLKRSQILMRRTDRLRSLETIAGGFAHEIRNPLTSIKTFVQLAPGRKHDDEFIDQFSQVVLEDVFRIERLIHEILDYARYREPQFLPEDLNEVVASCLYFIEVKASSKLVTIERHFAPQLPAVMLDRQQIKQVLLNLFLNAMDAIGDTGGRLRVKTQPLHKPGDTWVQIEVADTGAGIAPANLEHIFDPFYTTKHESGEREGTGLGLTIVHQIVQEHRGYIEVESQPGKGTTFSISLRVDPVRLAPAKESRSHEKTGVVG